MDASHYSTHILYALFDLVSIQLHVRIEGFNPLYLYVCTCISLLSLKLCCTSVGADVCIRIYCSLQLLGILCIAILCRLNKLIEMTFTDNSIPVRSVLFSQIFCVKLHKCMYTCICQI